MDFQQLTSFYAIVAQKSFTRAANVVHRTQPTLSHQMKALSLELGVELFDRTSREVVLTPAGKRFYRFTQDIIDKFAILRDDLRELSSQRRIRIACAETLAHMVLPSYIRTFMTTHPDVDIRVMSLNPAQSLDMLRTGQLDFVVAMRSMVQTGMDARTWRHGRYMLMVPKGHPLSGNTALTLEEMVRYRLIVPRRNSGLSSRFKFDTKLVERGLVPTLCMEEDSVPLKAEYVRFGFGICFLLVVRETLLLHPDELDFVPMDHIFAPEDVVICSRSREELSPVANELFCALLCDSQRVL